MIFNNYMLNQEVSTPPHLDHREEISEKSVFVFKRLNKHVTTTKMCSFKKALARSLCISEETAIIWELKKFKHATLVDATSSKLPTKASVLYLQR